MSTKPCTELRNIAFSRVNYTEHGGTVWACSTGILVLHLHTLNYNLYNYAVACMFPVDVDRSVGVVNHLSLPALSGLQNFTEGINEEGFLSGRDRQYILTGTSFGMDGCIHQVKVLAEVHGGVLAIDVWRPDSQSSGFTLASSAEISPSIETRAIFLLDASPPVQFQTGDLVGFHLVGNTGNFQVAWTSAPVGLTMSSIFTQSGEPPGVTTFPGPFWTDVPTTWPIMFLSTSSAGMCYFYIHCTLIQYSMWYCYLLCVCSLNQVFALELLLQQTVLPAQIFQSHLL